MSYPEAVGQHLITSSFPPLETEEHSSFSPLEWVLRYILSPCNNCKWFRFFSATTLSASQVPCLCLFISSSKVWKFYACTPLTLFIKGLSWTISFAGNAGVKKMLLPAISPSFWRAVLPKLHDRDLPLCLWGRFLDRSVITCWEGKARPTVVSLTTSAWVTHDCWSQH